MAFTFLINRRELTPEQKTHLAAVNATAEQLLKVLRGDNPDPRCMLNAIQKLEECVHWAEAAIRG